MKYYLLVNEGLEETAKQELKELFKVDAKISKNVLEFEMEEEIDSSKIQSGRRLLIAIEDFPSKEINLPQEFGWGNFLPAGKKFKIEVEGVKGQENRLEISRNLGGQIFKILENKSSPKLELKKPEILVVVYFNGEKYFIGIENRVEELNSRTYRVFPHQASFKGDLAYFFVRKSKFKKGKKLLVGFCKDGIMAIEAALYSGGKIYAFDDSTQNTTAARKNSQLAKVKDLVQINKFSLEELDVKFSEREFDNIIFQLTTKDENKLNEIYYQVKYVLKSKGYLLIIGRENFDPSISASFNLVSKEIVKRGGSKYKIWLLEKK